MSLERHPMVEILTVGDLAESLNSCPTGSGGAFPAEEFIEEPFST